MSGSEDMATGTQKRSRTFNITASTVAHDAIQSRTGLYEKSRIVGIVGGNANARATCGWEWIGHLRQFPGRVARSNELFLDRNLPDISVLKAGSYATNMGARNGAPLNFLRLRNLLSTKTIERSLTLVQWD